MQIDPDNGKRYLFGDELTEVTFGNILATQYTICSITRHMGVGPDSSVRILTTSDPDINWYHGHWADIQPVRTGVAAYGTWTVQANIPELKDKWLALCGQNGGDLWFRANGIDGPLEIDNNPVAEPIPQEIGVNIFPDKNSVFGIMDVITWDRWLTPDEIELVIDFLEFKLSGQSEIKQCDPTDPPIMEGIDIYCGGVTDFGDTCFYDVQDGYECENVEIICVGPPLNYHVQGFCLEKCFNTEDCNLGIIINR
eukprot:UN33180